ncbi:MAG: TonB-dependent receptor [Geobacteraceae bacterium]
MKIKSVFPSLLLIILACHAPTYAQSNEEMNILRMFYEDKDLVETATRSPKPISQVAENMTVITAEEIEAINAHTLADVLNYVPGMQMEVRGGPGAVTNVYIQGSEFRHVLLLIDGVELNNLADRFPDTSAIPVQHIERVEIIKGPAASAWGSSLGGVINVITKSPDDERALGGTASASIGERNTGDYRGELSGKVGRLGYYLSTGKLLSDGLTQNTHFDGDNLYTKLRWSANEKTNILFTLGYIRGFRGMGEVPEIDISENHDFDYLFTTLALNHAITEEMDLNLSVRRLRQGNNLFFNRLSDGAPIMEITGDDETYGGSVKLNWRLDTQNLLFGFDIDSGEVKANYLANGKQGQKKWALFANDTISVGRFSVTPGLRYDHTSTNGDFYSPSLGVTCVIGEHTTLRGYVTRGFNTPHLSATFGDGAFSVPNPGLKMEKVWTYQVGAESALLKYFWGKGTLFWHDVRDAISVEDLPDSAVRYINSEKQRRRGVEVEVRTIPFYNTSLSAGYLFVDTKNLNTGERIPDIARQTVDLGIEYNDRKALQATLKGHYIWWNADPFFNGRYKALIWDLNVSRRFYQKESRSIEAFFTAHNIFNGSQYLIGAFPNPRRWLEGGIRFKF